MKTPEINLKMSNNTGIVPTKNITVLEHHSENNDTALGRQYPTNTGDSITPQVNSLTLNDFNKLKTDNKTSIKKNQKGQKFPMPRNPKPNTYPDREISFLELTGEMIQYYDNKTQPNEYKEFVINTLDYKTKQKKKKTKKTNKKGKNLPKAEGNKPNNTLTNTVQFGDIMNQTFILSNAVKIPERKENTLPYIQTEIGLSNDTITLEALKDSGASHSLLEIEEFKKIKGHKNMPIQAKQLKMVTPNATTENAIQGEVILDITMTDITGTKVIIPHPFLLAKLGGKQKCIIGYDFLSREDIIIGETPKHIFIKLDKKNHAIEVNKGNVGTQKTHHRVKTKTTITLEANSVQTINLVYESNTNEITSLNNSECIFQPNTLALADHQKYGIVMHPALTITKKISENEVELIALITNTNNEPMTLKANTIVGEIEDISNNKMTIPMQEDDFKTLANHIELQEDHNSTQMENIEFYTSEESGIFTFEMQPDSEEIEINSIFNRKENIEKETRLSDGSIRTQMTAEIEDILECETAIDPSDLLDKAETLDISMANFTSERINRHSKI